MFANIGFLPLWYFFVLLFLIPGGLKLYTDLLLDLATALSNESLELNGSLDAARRLDVMALDVPVRLAKRGNLFVFSALYFVSAFLSPAYYDLPEDYWEVHRQFFVTIRNSFTSFHFVFEWPDLPSPDTAGALSA